MCSLHRASRGAAGIALLLGIAVPAQAADEPAGITRHRDCELGIEFEYREGPDGYLLEVVDEDPDQPGIVRRLVLVLESEHRQLPEAGEGPPTIGIAAAPNPEGLSPAEWAAGNPGVSNLHLKLTEIDAFELAGASAIRYLADGLYVADTVVATHGGYAYVVSGAYLDADSTIRRDFEPLLQSIRFLPAGPDLHR